LFAEGELTHGASVCVVCPELIFIHTATGKTNRAFRVNDLRKR